MSRLVDIHNLKEIKEYYDLTVFVESGCFQGEGLEYARDVLGFDEENLYSCDVDESYVKLCQEKLPKAAILNVNSLDFLLEVLPRSASSLFWLDAHHSAHYGKQDTNQWPLWEELNLIKNLQQHQNDVILCDDFHAVPGHWRHNPNVVPQDTRTTEDYYKLLDTHHHVHHPVSTSIMMFFPKNRTMLDWGKDYHD